MQTRGRDLFTTIHVEGAILPPDLLQRISLGDTDLKGLTPTSYHLLEGEKINEVISRSWNRMLGAWTAFQEHLGKLPDTDFAISLTREKWLLHLFRELGYGRLMISKAIEIEGKPYRFSHLWQNTPIHLVGYRVDLDKRTAGVAGAASSSPHSMVQEFLNRSDDHLWAYVSNGKKLRILRDNVSLTRQAYVEFDMEAMMNGEVYSDFVMLWMLCHQSRVEAEQPENCWLEQWSKAAQAQGTRALDQLRSGVETAITSLGCGFLSHKANQVLRTKLRSGELDKQDYYRQLLRLVYQLIFLFVAEDRNALLIPGALQSNKDRYNHYYSTNRLRQLAGKRRGTKHSDLFQGFQIVIQILQSKHGCPELALPALGSFLFSERATKDITDCEITNKDFLDTIRSLAIITDGRTRRHVDYKNLGSEELGSVYESLLELHPDLDLDNGHFELRTAGGNERKSTGSYYTPSSLIQVLLDSALNPVLDEATKKDNPEQAILNLKICDPACGSGHFLIAAAHRVAHRLAAVTTGDEEPAPEAIRHALRRVVSHCIYGVDINEMAVELCKVGLWMEAMEPGKPLSFLDHRILCGNSLLGATPALLKKGIPDEAFKPIEGDDRKICSEYKKLNKRERETRQTDLFYDAEQPWNRLGNFTTAMTQVDDVEDDSIEGIHAKQNKYEELVYSTGYLFGHLLADLWCTAFVWKKTRDLPYSITEEVFRNVEKNPHTIQIWMYKEVQRLKEQYKFFHWHLAYPDVFRVPGKNEQPDNNHTGWCGGFDVVLGNPPWERIKLQEKEWFAERRPEITNAPNAARRRALIAELENTDNALYKAFQEDKRKAEGESHLVRNSGIYPLNGRGDINTYAIFSELKRNINGFCGRVGCIVPSGIATDDTTKFFFQDLMEKKSLVSLYDFENRNGLFPGVHRSYKFCLLTLTGYRRHAAQGADFVFFALDTTDLREDERHFTLTDEEIKLINPNTKTCPIFRSKRDAEITKAVYRRVPVLINENDPENGNPWGISFMRMFDMANDSHLFKTKDALEIDGYELYGNVFHKKNDSFIPLYESKMIHQFDHRWLLHDVQINKKKDVNRLSFGRYFVNKKDIEKKLNNRWKFKWFLVWRKIARNTDERTFISTIIPYYGFSDSGIIGFPKISDISNICFLILNFNAIVFDFITRQKISGTNMAHFITQQLPVQTINQYNYFTKDFCIPRALEMLYTANDMSEFASSLRRNNYPFKVIEDRRFIIRCEIDAAYFHLYGIERKDVDYIMETFPIIKRKDEQKYGEYRTKRVILEIFDEMAEAKRTGKAYQTRLDPPPADPRVAHKV